MGFLGQILGRKFPIQQLTQHGLEIFGPRILIIQIIGMLPHIDGQEELTPLAIGVSALGVFSIANLPPLLTSQAQPDPNCVLPASASCAINASLPPKAAVMALSNWPLAWVFAGVRLRQ